MTLVQAFGAYPIVTVKSGLRNADAVSRRACHPHIGLGRHVAINALCAWLPG